MIRARVCYGIWMLIALGGYLYFDSYLAFFLLVVSAVMVLWCGLSILPLQKSLFYSFGMEKITEKGKPAEGVLRIDNKSILPIGNTVCFLRFYNQLTGEVSRQKVSSSLCRKKAEELQFTLLSSYCGNVEVKVEKVICYDFFALFSRRFYPDAKGHIIVLPHIFPIEVAVVESDMDNRESVMYSSLKKGTDPSEIFGVREYVWGDSPKNIHWKLSSKLDQLYIKELSLPVENSILLIYETGIIGADEEPKQRDAMMEAFLSISQALAQQGHTHVLSWYDQNKGLVCYEEIGTTDELAALSGGLLALSCKENPYSTVHYYLQEYEQHPYTHIVYIGIGKAGEELSRLQELCMVAVPDCTGEEELCQVVV